MGILNTFPSPNFNTLIQHSLENDQPKPWHPTKNSPYFQLTYCDVVNAFVGVSLCFPFANPSPLTCKRNDNFFSAIYCVVHEIRVFEYVYYDIFYHFHAFPKHVYTYLTPLMSVFNQKHIPVFTMTSSTNMPYETTPQTSPVIHKCCIFWYINTLMNFVPQFVPFHKKFSAVRHVHRFCARKLHIYYFFIYF